MSLLLLMAAAQVSPPAKPLDPKDARSVAEHAIFNTRKQGRYETAFKAILAPAEGDRFERKGTSLWLSQGILSLHYMASGNREMNVLRVQDDVWIYSHGFKQWATAAEDGDDQAGRGLENPEEALALLSSHLDKARFDSKGSIELALVGKALAEVLKGFPQADDIDTDASSMKVRLEKDSVGRLKSVAFLATLRPKKKALNIAGSYEASAEFSYDGKGALRAVDEGGKELPFSETMLNAIGASSSKKKTKE
jgi:hypothetical protein